MIHISTIHTFSYKGRIWKMSIDDNGNGKLITRKPPFTWDKEWKFTKMQKGPTHTMRIIRDCWKYNHGFLSKSSHQ